MSNLAIAYVQPEPSVAANHIIFDKATKTATISLDQLERTTSLASATGRLSKTAPVEHSAFIRKILELSAYADVDALLEPLVVKENNIRRLQQHQNKDLPLANWPLEHYLVQRITTKIVFQDPFFTNREDAKGSLAIGISYTEKGIQVAFGHNVFVCSNLNVFGENFFSTFGNEKNRVPFEKGLELLQAWMMRYTVIRNDNQRRIQRLMEVPVTEERRLQVIGKLFENAVRANNNDRTVVAPLNQSECGWLINAGYDQITTNREISAWDLTNWATSVLKPEKGDTLEMLRSNFELNSFLYNELVGA